MIVALKMSDIRARLSNAEPNYLPIVSLFLSELSDPYFSPIVFFGKFVYNRQAVFLDGTTEHKSVWISSPFL